MSKMKEKKVSNIGKLLALNYQIMSRKGGQRKEVVRREIRGSR